MSSLECLNNDWIINLNNRPSAMSPVDPPSYDENNSRILWSIYAMTLADEFTSHNIKPYILQHIQMERECSNQNNLTLAWSDDVSLTLCFLASLAHHGKYSQEHLLQRYFHWWMHGYMSPTALCFTPRVYTKKAIDLFGETQAAQALGFEVDIESKSFDFSPRPSALLRMSPISYFYCRHSAEIRRNILNDCAKRMFGSKSSTDVLMAYIELLVNALNGLSKDEVIQSIQLKRNPDDWLNRVFFDLVDLISNDNNHIEHGIQLAIEKSCTKPEECHYLNPLNSDETILLTLYLQISAALYNRIPEDWLNRVHAKRVLESIAKWVMYQSKKNLHSI